MPYINVYLTDRAYGGPEEGGWWFDTGEPVESVQCGPDQIDDVKTLEEEKWLPHNEGRPEVHSVLSQGQYRVMVEDHFAREYPEVKPYYE